MVMVFGVTKFLNLINDVSIYLQTEERKQNNFTLINSFLEGVNAKKTVSS